MISRSIYTYHRFAVPALWLLSLLGVSVALADDPDPPSRVARLSFTNGSVSLQPAGVQDWGDATLNRPLTTGDKLWTDQDSRAELDLGTAAVRLGSTTGLSFLNLDDQMTQMSVTAGTAIVHVGNLGDNQTFEIDTPNIAVTLQSPGDYRVEVNDAGNTTVVKVSDGNAEVNATGQTVPVQTQQAYTFTGTDQVTVDAGSVGTPDVLDEWSLDRDHQAEQAQSNQYVAPDVVGTEDLDNYGSWQQTPDYGYVWTPTAVAVGWSPYHFGHWVWVAPWGWTWVDDAPWGFAPFHYGRWAFIGSNWAWVPGPRRIRPVYAPALVAWVGGRDPGVSVGVGGGVGWFPLAPREVFVPGYHVSSNYVRNVNISNTTAINNTYITNVYENRVANITYANRDRPGALVAVPQSVFTSAQPVSGHTISMPPGELAQFAVHGAAPAIVPVRASVLAVRPGVNVRRPPAVFANRPIVARVTPPPAPIAFERQQEAIRTNGGRPLARSQVVELQPRAPNPRVRVVAPGPVRPVQNGRAPDRPAAFGAQQGTQGRSSQQSLIDRERALHATPIPPSQQNALGNDRPPSVQQNLDGRSAPAQNQFFRNDRPPTTPLPRPQTYPQSYDSQRQVLPEAHPIPQAHPIEQSSPATEYHATEQPRPATEYRAVEPPHPVPQAHPIEPPRAAPQQRPVPPPPRPEEKNAKPAPQRPEARFN